MGAGDISFWFQKGQLVFMGNLPKKLPQAGQNCGITEVELTGFVWSTHIFSHLYQHQYFEVLVDHKDIKNVQKGKKEVTMNKLRALPLKLWDYIFKL